MNGNVDMTGHISDSGHVSMSGDISGTETTSNTCSTTYTPPTTQNIDIQKPVLFLLADTETSRMVLTCTRNVLWSQCIALNPGLFEARNDNGHFEVLLSSHKGKDGWVKFNIVQQTAFSEQEQEQKQESLEKKLKAQEPESLRVQMKKADADNCPSYSATLMRFLLSHPDVVAASGTAQRGTAPGQEMRAYLNDHQLDKCSDASWVQAYEALKATDAFRLK